MSNHLININNKYSIPQSVTPQALGPLVTTHGDCKLTPQINACPFNVL